MADIFLSYARPNAAEAAGIAEAFSARGYSVWFDADLPAHRAYAEVIEEQLEAASAVLVLWSKDSVASQWVRSEANRAREGGRLVQVRLDDTRLPMPFDQIQCADLSGSVAIAEAPGWRTVIKSIAALAPEPMAPRLEPSLGKARPPRASRRGLIIGGLATATAVAAGGGWFLLGRRDAGPPISPATAALMQQAKIALWQNTREGQTQAIGMYRQIVTDNPTYADGWGYLSIIYSWIAHYRQTAEASALRERARSAARRALTLDDANPLGMVGNATARTNIGNWLSIERALRHAVDERPKLDDLAFLLAILLSQVGRLQEALKYVNLVLPSGPTPAVFSYQAALLWSAGRAEELDNRLAEAARIYPTHFALWFARFYYAMFDGRPDEAIALAADTGSRPSGIDPAEIDAVVRVAKAIQTRDPAEVDAVTHIWMERAKTGTGLAENAAQFMAALGKLDDAFIVLRAYYFSEVFDCGEVRFSKGQGTYTPRNDRLTAWLWGPSMAPVRADPRFSAVADRLGLTEYWKSSGVLPDYLAHRAG